MPLWDDGFELSYVSYQTTTAVYHLGATLQSGHYRAALSQRARDGSLQWAVTDDGVFPVRAKAADLKILHENVYLVGLCRSELDRN